MQKQHLDNRSNVREACEVAVALREFYQLLQYTGVLFSLIGQCCRISQMKVCLHMLSLDSQ